MNQSSSEATKSRPTIEARRLAELARAAGLGDSPDEAFKTHQTALSLLGTDEQSALLADVLRWQGVVLTDRGRASDAEPLYRRSLEISTALQYDSGRAHALNCLAGLQQRRGDLTGAANMLSDALEIASRCGETRLVGMLQQNLGIIADIRGNPAAALAHYLVALRTFEATNDLQQVCWTLNNLGYLYVKEQRFDEAESSFDRALQLARSRGDLRTEGIVEENRGELCLLRGELQSAGRSIERALDIAERRHDDVRKGAALKLRGAFERMSGRCADAVETLRRAMTLSAIGEDALLGAEILYQFGNALHCTGDITGAREVWQAALDAFERIAARQWVGRVRGRLTGEISGRYL